MEGRKTTRGNSIFTMKKQTPPLSWVPSLYFAQGLPYVIVMNLAVIMYKRLGISNTDIALYTSWLYLPWVIKPLWSPVVDVLKTKRWWILVMQIVIGGALAGVAFTLPGSAAFRYSLAFMWLLAFSSATHDIAIDGYYLLELSERQQAFYVGWRSTFYRIASLTGQGLVVMLAGYLEKYYSAGRTEAEAIPLAWSSVFYILAGFFVLLFLYHQFILPRPEKDHQQEQVTMETFKDTLITFFSKKELLAALLFILFFRFSEAQLVKIASPFLLDEPGKGGLGLETGTVGFIYGTVGLIALTAGGILGGMVIARQGLRYWIWWMTLAMNIPNAVYLYMAFALPSNPAIISACVAIEQLGYGFGFTALAFFMMRFSAGKYQTAHYAFCTGFMALGMMLPGMASGFIQEQIGYQWFFVWIMLATIPSFLATKIVCRGK